MTRIAIALLFTALPLAGCSRPTPGVALTTTAVDQDAGPQEFTTNPAYRQWAAFRPGAAVTYRSVTEAEGEQGKTTTTTTYKLIEITDDSAVIEMTASTTRYDGLVTNNPAERLSNPRLIAAPRRRATDDTKPPADAVSEEVVEVAGKKFKSRRKEGKASNEAGEVLVSSWTSDEVPGGLVKSITHTPAIGKKTTIELIEITLP